MSTLNRDQAPYIDCHAHVADKEFDEDRDAMLERAWLAGVSGIVVVPEALAECPTVLSLARHYNDKERQGPRVPYLGVCAGIHPEKIKELLEQDADVLDKLSTWVDEHVDDICAIGEVGLDFSPYIAPDGPSKDQQREAFRYQYTLAARHSLPLSIHSRSAGRPMIELLSELQASRVCLHAFDGNKKVAKRGIALGYYFSIPASVVRSEQKQELVKLLPLSQLLLESDAPALAPIKGPGQRNECMNVVLACQKIAELKGTSEEEVRRATYENAQRLFPKAFLI